MKGAAAVIEDHKNDILEDWVERVRTELSAPKQTADPVLRDHLPLFIDDLIAVLRGYEDFRFDKQMKNFDGLLDHSIGHGYHRSTSSGYDMEQVLKEYIILHRQLTDLLRSEDVYSVEVADQLKYIIENSMTYAAVAFQKSLREMRQKLMGTLVHDVRNPISAAQLALGMLDQKEDPEKFYKIKNLLQKSINRSLGLIEDILESITVGAGVGITLHFKEQDLSEFILSVYEEASEIYSNEIRLDWKKEPIVGVFDSTMIRRVLENIISNAVKYGTRGSKITLWVQNSSESVEIGVHNQGDPVPEGKQKEIFRFLKTTGKERNQKKKSWGMGLTLVNAVARAHAGYVDLMSTHEDGTTFKLVLQKFSNEPGKLETSVQFSFSPI